jgi:hypothetical protein
MGEYQVVENWNPYGWLLMAGGFLFGVALGWFGVGGSYWMIGYGAMLAGLTILITNMMRALWRYGRRRKALFGRRSS